MWPLEFADTTPGGEIIFIKAYEECGGVGATYKFHATSNVQPYPAGLRPQQTKSFLDLPAELRNQIYASVLDNSGSERLPHKQPALSLTCKQVNKEFLSLLFEKHQWLICA